MTMTRSTRLLIPLLALATTFAVATSAQSQNRYQRRSDGTTATLRVTLGSTLHWSSVSGTRVEELPQSERPGYDVFRYGGSYYVYNNSQWYSSPNDRGDFNVIDDRDVPSEFNRVPRDHWRNYPSAWSQQDNSPRTSASLQIQFGSAPHWSSIGGTRVEEIRQDERPGYDMFRYGGVYYVYNNSQWYSSRYDHGDFGQIDDRDVPADLVQVPREHWRSYPQRWANSNGPSYRGPDHSYGTLDINFGRNTRWMGVRGTRVQVIRQGRQRGYDMFRYGGTFYAYSDGRWYRSNDMRGRYTYIDDRFVPREFSRVPRDYWQTYPTGWDADAPGYRSPPERRR